MAVPQIGSIGEQLDILIRQGANFGPYSVGLYQDAAKTQPINLTGAQFRAQIRKKALDTAVTIAITCTITDAVNGKFTFGLTSTQTAVIKAGESIKDGASLYVWDMEWQDSAGKVFPLYYGQATVFREVTRA